MSTRAWWLLPSPFKLPAAIAELAKAAVNPEFWERMKSLPAPRPRPKPKAKKVKR